MATRTILTTNKPRQCLIYSPSPKSTLAKPVVTMTYELYPKTIPISPLHARSLSNLYAKESDTSLFSSNPPQVFSVTSGSKLKVNHGTEPIQQEDMGEEEADRPQKPNVRRPVLRQGSNAINMDTYTADPRGLLPDATLNKRKEVKNPDQPTDVFPQILVPHATIRKPWTYPSYGSFTNPVASPSTLQAVKPTTQPYLRTKGRDHRCTLSERSAMLVFSRARVAKRDFAEPFCKLNDFTFCDWFLRTMSDFGVDDDWVVWRLRTVMKDEARAIIMEEVEFYQVEVAMIALGRGEEVRPNPRTTVSLRESRCAKKERKRKEREARQKEFWNNIELRMLWDRAREQDRVRGEEEGFWRDEARGGWARFRLRIPGMQWVKRCFRWIFRIKKEERPVAIIF